jgi:uncharacterized protein (DUF302 family)
MTLRADGTLDQVLRRAITRIEALGLDVHAVIDHSGDAADVGVTIPETKLVLFGSPKDLAGLIGAHPRLAIELPCKLLVCESDDGEVTISCLAPDALAERYSLSERETAVLGVVDRIARRTQTAS